jgi:ParB-like chromosome segregation protein Spo0J
VATPPVLATELVPIDRLTEHPENYNRGNDAAVAELLDRFGQWRPAVVQTATGYVLIGNTMLRAARSLGWDHLNVHWRDVGDDDARRILAADNRASELSVTDEPALAALLSSLGDDLSGTLWTPPDLADLVASLQPPDLDDLLDAYGEPTDADALTRVAFRATPEIAALWADTLKATGADGDRAAAAAVLAAHRALVGPDPP